FHRLHEAGTLGLHDEADRIAMRATAEAVVVAILVHIEARCLFAVEWAAALPLPARPHESCLAPDDRRERRAGTQFVEKPRRERHQRFIPFAPPTPSRQPPLH